MSQITSCNPIMVIIYPQMGVASANYVNYSPKMDILQFAQLQSHKGTGYASFLEMEIIEWKFYTHLIDL